MEKRGEGLWETLGGGWGQYVGGIREGDILGAETYKVRRDHTTEASPWEKEPQIPNP